MGLEGARGGQVALGLASGLEGAGGVKARWIMTRRSAHGHGAQSAWKWQVTGPTNGRLGTPPPFFLA